MSPSRSWEHVTEANFPPNIVSNANIAKIFGLSFEDFKTTNLNLHLETRKDLFRLYYKVTNNEFMIWFVKGYIAKEKGEKINWVKATPSTTREKAHKEEAKQMKSESIDFV